MKGGGDGREGEGMGGGLCIAKTWLTIRVLAGCWRRLGRQQQCQSTVALSCPCCPLAVLLAPQILTPALHTSTQHFNQGIMLNTQPKVLLP